ncbi:PINIT domain-containing protein [Cantharellus anzutake]|uniref:PINIT domain-containing protein n=1 Tax=Cantharellus anzutake TaxID=1750568 RepID=UPI00190688F6|nr:PINIT domain-containing protein [Cantharellus anzutake]KAF8332340.1 PINIT domain-containing protein [Cantharellus anzutake]
MSGVWDDFHSVWTSVGHNTVDRLKAIINGLNVSCRTSIPKSGKKQDHIDRIRAFLTHLRENGDIALWNASKAVISPRPPAAPTSSTTAPYPTGPPRSHPYTPSAAGPSGSSTAWTQARSHLNGPVYSGSSSSKPTIRFKLSPFFSVENPLSDIISVSETKSNSERGAAVVHFSLNQELLTKLSSPSHQLRLYCTSSSFYTPGGNVWSSQACPIEFPPVCELKMNGHIVTANTRGMKKKPGTAPPVDLGKYSSTGLNRIDMTYVNNSQPFVMKKYYLLANLVRVTTVDQWVDKIRSSKLRSAEIVKASLFKNKEEDDEIVAGAQTMSLKCPLSYMRLRTPCRSQLCLHSQCFDATSWFMMMEQTTTYLCPVCDKALNVDDLIMDGYVSDILNVTPDTVEDVIIEPDGEWHTEGGEFSSAGWESKKPASVNVKRDLSPDQKPMLPSAQPNGNNVFFVDSDDDGDEQVHKHDLSHMSTTSKSSGETRVATRAGGREKAPQVIDLTFDSDSDSDGNPRATPRPATNGSKRRGSHDVNDQLSKRLRTDDSVSSGDTYGGNYVGRPPDWTGGMPDVGARGYGGGRESSGQYYSCSPPQTSSYLPHVTPAASSPFFTFNSPRLRSPPITFIGGSSDSSRPHIRLPPLRSLDNSRSPPTSEPPPSWMRD